MKFISDEERISRRRCFQRLLENWSLYFDRGRDRKELAEHLNRHVWELKRDVRLERDLSLACMAGSCTEFYKSTVLLTSFLNT